MIIDKQKHSHHLKLRPHAQFAVGSDVEVSSDEEGFLGIWFPARILSPPSKTHKNKYLVEYKTLVSDEKEANPLRELVHPSFIRPELPPKEGDERCFELNDFVEAYNSDGWWIGVVTGVLGDRGYRVFFQNPGEELEFERSSLRLHMDWVDGKWVLPDMQTTDELIFGPGTAVEVKLDARGSPDIWYPGTVVKEIGKRYFVVEYKSSNNTKFLNAVVDYLHIRPLPPRCNSITFQLLDKVDAFCNFGWSSGIITKILGDGRYIVFFQQTKKEKELGYTDLRLPMVQINGKWLHSLQDAVVVSNAQEDSRHNLNDDGKITLPPENSVGMNGSVEELRNCQEEQAVPVGTSYVDNRTVNLVREQATVNSSTYIMPCEKLNEGALSYEQAVQFPPKIFGTKAPFQEELNDQSPASLEIPSSDMEDNGSMGNSSSSVKMLEAQGEKFDFSTNKRAPSRRRKGRGRRRTLRSVIRTTRPSAVVKGTPGKGNELTHVNDGHVNTANECEHEREVLTDEGTSPKRKRGRANGAKTKETHHIIVGNETLRRSTRQRKIVFESLMVAHTYRRKKLKLTEKRLSSTQEYEDSPQLEDEAVLMNTEPVSKCDSGNKSDDDRPLSTWTPWPANSSTPPLVDDTKSEGCNHVSNGAVDLRMTTEMLSSTQVSKWDSGNNSDDVRPLSSWLPHPANLHTPPFVDDTQSEDSPKQKAEVVVTNTVTENPKPVSNQHSGNSDDSRPLSSCPPGPADSPSPCLADETCKLVTTIAESEGRNCVLNGTVEHNDVPMMTLSFTKSSPIWNTVEAIEVFQQIPQNPHFHPLYETKEGCREGLAIGLMVTFAGLVEKVSKLHFSEPGNIFNDIMETLTDMEIHGFNVQPVRARLRELMSIKSQHEHSLTLSEQVRSQIECRERERAEIDEEINDIDKKIAELKDKRVLAVSRVEIQNDEIEELQGMMDSMKDKIEAERTKFDTVANAPW